MESSNKLKVFVNSFSYKRGMPYDPEGNGGGFVFDCRGLENPGRYVRYAFLTGKDQEVIDFMEKNSRSHEFLKYILAIVEVNISNYMTRNFSNLMINFGCTGGQHRSVYCAEQLAAALKEKYDEKIIVECNHLDLTQF
ncbi:MAG: RNase adapter RapZ [Bacteroidales bacterium]